MPEVLLHTKTREVLGESINYFVYGNGHILVDATYHTNGWIEADRRLINCCPVSQLRRKVHVDAAFADRKGSCKEASLPPGLAGSVQNRELRVMAAAKFPNANSLVFLGGRECPILQLIFNIEARRMAIGRVRLICDAFVTRSHAAAGTAKAATELQMLAEAMRPKPTDSRQSLCEKSYRSHLVIRPWHAREDWVYDHR